MNALIKGGPFINETNAIILSSTHSSFFKMMPHVALVVFLALVLLMASTSHAIPTSAKRGDGDGSEFHGQGKRDVQDTCPKPDRILQTLWDDLSYGPDDWGCEKGYCWSRCAGAGRAAKSFINLYEWCYTTKGSSQDRNYVTCDKKEDCCSTWSCGGPCAAI